MASVLRHASAMMSKLRHVSSAVAQKVVPRDRIVLLRAMMTLIARLLPATKEFAARTPTHCQSSVSTHAARTTTAAVRVVCVSRTSAPSLSQQCRHNGRVGDHLLIHLRHRGQHHRGRHHRLHRDRQDRQGNTSESPKHWAHTATTKSVLV